jgi:hypothetical protein
MSAKSLVPLIPLLVLTTASCAPKPGGQNPGPLVVMIPGRLAKEGSFEDCVYQKMQGGMKLADALAECAKLEPPDLSGTGLDPFDLMDGGTGVRLSDCYGDWNNNAPIEHSANYNEAKHAVQQIAIAKVLRDALVSDWLHETDPQIKKELDDAVDKMSSIASEALAQYESASKTLTADEQAYLQSLHRNDPSPYEPKKPAGTSPPGDWVPPDDNTGVARPATEGQSLCQAVSEFVGECNRDGWLPRSNGFRSGRSRRTLRHSSRRSGDRPRSGPASLLGCSPPGTRRGSLHRHHQGTGLRVFPAHRRERRRSRSMQKPVCPHHRRGLLSDVYAGEVRGVERPRLDPVGSREIWRAGVHYSGGAT